MQLIDKEGQYNSSILLHQSQDNGRDGRGTEDGVSSPIASLDRHDWKGRSSPHIKVKLQKWLTFSHIPTKMPQTVDGVEGKRSSEDRFSGVFDYFRKTGNELNDVSAVKGSRCHQIGNRETIEHCASVNLSTPVIQSFKWYSQTLSPAPVTRLAIEPNHVSCGW